MTAKISRNPLQAIKAVVFTIAGLCVMTGAVFEGVSTRRFLKQAASAPGEVTQLRAGGSHPEVRFTTAKGEVVEYPQNGMISGYRVGDKVEVLYDPQNPALDPVIKSWGALWGFCVMTFGMGAVFVGVAQIIWRYPGWNR